MRRTSVAGAVLLIMAWAASAMAGILPGGAERVSAQAKPGKVLIVSFPRLVWQDVSDQRPPALSSFLTHAAYASLSVRAIGPSTDLGEGYVTLGAGNRARVDPRIAGDAVGADEQVGARTGAALYRAVTGNAPGSAAVLSLAVEDARRDAHQLLYGAEPGALGQTVEAAGMHTAVIANGDGGPPAGADKLHREAVLSLMDEAGRVDDGVVDRSLSVVDPAAPGGYRMDDTAVVSAFERSWADDDVVMVELSDLERADRNGLAAGGPARVHGLADPLRRADAMLAQLLRRVDLRRDRVIIVSPAAPAGLGRLTVFAMAGPGVAPGLARSATTRRDGYVTLPDVGVTVLDALGLHPPDSMNATAITSDGGRPFSATEAGRLADLDDLAHFRDRTVGPVSVVYIVLQVLTYALAALALVSRRPRLRRMVGLAALIILAVPLVAFLSGLTDYHRLDLVSYVVVVFALSSAVGAGALLLRRAHPFLPALLLVTANWALLVIDIVLGGRLQLDTPFGYSPIIAGRFQGFGNLAFAILASSAIVVATGVVALSQSTWPVDAAVGFVATRAQLRWAVGIFFVTVVVDGFPSFGSDVGGVLAAVPAFAVAVILLGGRRVSVRKLVLVGVGTLVAISALAALDLSRPAKDRTHLGRFATELFNGHAGVVIHRKVQSNWFILTSSVWTWLVPVALAFVAFLALRRHGFLNRLQRRVPGVRPCLLSALVVGGLGFALNDSGVAVPAMMFGIVLPWVTWLLLATEPPDGAARSAMSPLDHAGASSSSAPGARSLEPTP